MTVVVRQIKSNEWKLAKQVRLDALCDSPQAFSTIFEEAQVMPDEHWQKRAEDGAKGEKSFSTIAIDNGVGVGMATGLADLENPSLSFLVAMWVNSNYRGTDTATLILDQVKMWSTISGAQVLLAGVKESNHRAQAFYRKVGFTTYNGQKLSSPAVCGCATILKLHL
ncbi:GNAT family N-acetyltransferase [Candidatus Uabimicrobium sp. HlEnr_7]|uniref:GNAT family N-acetyltransferase n=1 Tax=Candidatus Uabimicrobium helgolandensis TaxID=3095367 RepID=UPI003556FCEF